MIAVAVMMMTIDDNYYHHLSKRANVFSFLESDVNLEIGAVRGSGEGMKLYGSHNRLYTKDIWSRTYDKKEKERLTGY